MSYSDALWRTYLDLKPANENIGFLTLYSLDNFESRFTAALSYPPDILAQKRRDSLQSSFFAGREDISDELGIFIHKIMENKGIISRSCLIEKLQDERIVSRKDSAAKESVDRLVGDFRKTFHYDENFPVLLTQYGTADKEPTYILDGFIEEREDLNGLSYGQVTGRILVVKKYGTTYPMEYVRQTRFSLTQRELECIEMVIGADGKFIHENKFSKLPSIKDLKNDKTKATRDAILRGLKKLDASDVILYEKKGYVYVG